MGSLMKVNTAAFAGVTGIEEICHVEHLKTSFYRIPVWLVIGVNLLSVILFLWMYVL